MDTPNQQQSSALAVTDDADPALDRLIRGHLMREGSHIAPPDRVLRSVLQRAQTEIEQLPAPTLDTTHLAEHADVGPAREDDSRASAAVILNERPLPRRRRVSLRETVAQYREVMDVKMLRIIGGNVSTLSVSR